MIEGTPCLNRNVGHGASNRSLPPLCPAPRTRALAFSDHIPLRLAIFAFSLHRVPLSQFQSRCYLDPQKTATTRLTRPRDRDMILQKGGPPQ
jgi:hypothetical protein